MDDEKSLYGQGNKAFMINNDVSSIYNDISVTVCFSCPIVYCLAGGSIYVYNCIDVKPLND